LGDVVSIDLDAQPELADGLLVDLRVFLGYAGWSGGQLDAEISLGGWIVLGADLSDPWTDDPDVLWRSVLSRQGWPVSAFASFPEDPGLN
jgi:putative transcriptional regulator